MAKKSKDIPPEAVAPKETAADRLQSAVGKTHESYKTWRAADAAYKFLYDAVDGLSPAPVLTYTVRGPEGEPVEVSFNPSSLSDEDSSTLVNYLLTDSLDNYLVALDDLVAASSAAKESVTALLATDE